MKVNKIQLWVKLVIVIATFLLVGLFTLGIVQTFVLKNLQNQNLLEQAKVEQQLVDNNNVQNEIDFKNSDEYKDEQNHSNGNVKEGEEIYK